MAEYKAALKKERRYSKNLVGELAALKSVAVTSTLEAEINEEGRINCLMRRLDVLQKEKGRIIVELEREEEMLTNTLQKKLNGVRREKEELERQIEKEHLIKARLSRCNPMIIPWNIDHWPLYVTSTVLFDFNRCLVLQQLQQCIICTVDVDSFSIRDTSVNCIIHMEL